MSSDVEATWTKFFLLACLVCDEEGFPLVLPFGSPEERGRWASGHRQGTGHDRWRVWDEVRES